MFAEVYATIGGLALAIALWCGDILLRYQKQGYQHLSLRFLLHHFSAAFTGVASIAAAFLDVFGQNICSALMKKFAAHLGLFSAILISLTSLFIFYEMLRFERHGLPLRYL